MKSQENMKLENLQKIRLQKKLTREELGALSGVKPETITALELGINDALNVKLSTLLALAQALDVKVIKLLPIKVQHLIA